MRVTAFLGAGSSLEIGGPSANELTTMVRQTTQSCARQDGHPVSARFIDEIAQQLNIYFHPDTCNLEDIYHALEMLTSHCRILGNSVVKEYKPTLGAFLNPGEERWFDRGMLYAAERNLIETVAERINLYVQDFRPSEEHSWFASFWRKAVEQCAWDICTLNYDSCIEQSVNSSRFEDGYYDIGKRYDRFNPKLLIETEKTRLLHLHGSILYGYPEIGDGFNPFEDNPEDLFNYRDFGDAKRTWFNRSRNNTQSHEQATIGPIITGLRKSDKLMAYPYSSYSYFLQKALLDSPALLVAGYSFGDLHFNHLLNRMASLHGDKRRIALVTYIAKEAWHPDPSVMESLNDPMFQFIARAFEEYRPFSDLRFRSPLISKDGKAKLYLKGFKDAVENHGDEILSFLTTATD